MSARRSLTTAVRDFLRSSPTVGGLGLDTSLVEVMGDGSPAPSAGQWFYAVHQGPRSNQLLTGEGSSFGVSITISARTEAPFDRIGTDQIDVMSGLDDRGEDVWNAVFAGQWRGDGFGIMNRANAILQTAFPGGTPYLWTEALYPSNMGVPEPIGPTWWNAEEDSYQAMSRAGKSIGTTGMARYCGFRMVISLTGAMRFQELGDSNS